MSIDEYNDITTDITKHQSEKKWKDSIEPKWENVEK